MGEGREVRMSAAVRSYFVPFVMQHRYFSARGIKQALGATPHFEQFSELASIFGATQCLPLAQSSLNECPHFRLKAQN